ncbi:MAG: nucleotide exchange factor GrpE [Spirochaetes bacterium]|nr:MAG: nucleotide exchange factor GrpE [Spirochaetota bacterium]
MTALNANTIEREDVMIKHPRNHGRESEPDKEEEKTMNGEGPSPSADTTRTAEPGMQDSAAADTQSIQPEEIKSLKEALKAKEEELVKKNEELNGLKDLMMRRQADFDNYKKRMVKSEDEYRKLAIKDIAVDVIQINDDILRAIDAAACVNPEQLAASHSAFIDGVSMISRRMEEMLKKYGVHEIDSLNKEFDPCMNEAVEITESGDVEHDTITKVYQKGFALDEYVVRSARVRVTRPSRNKQGLEQSPGQAESDCREQGAAEAKI